MSVDERRPGSRPSGHDSHNRPSRDARPQQRPVNGQGSARRPDPRREQVQRDPHRRPPEHGRPVRRPNPPRKKSSAGKVVLIIFEILVLLALGVALYFVLTATKSGKMDLPEEDIIINEEVKEKLKSSSAGSSSGDNGAYSGYRNIALFGVDSREGALTKNTRSDTIMVASINMETGDVKLVSIYRDTYLNLGNDEYNKCNSAYAKGGPKQAINMLNMNFDLDITDFVTIGFDGLIDVIDGLGGIEINVLDSEIKHLNNYQISMVGKSSDGVNFTANEGVDYIPVKSAGLQTLNGLQATAYCRIRYVGDDFQRAERQRAVIKAILEKAKANPGKLGSIAESVFSETYTSLDLSEIISILGDIAKYRIVDEAGYPDENLRSGATVGSKGACIVPLTLADNVTLLHEFLFGETDYDPSSAVKGYSQTIINDAGQYMH
ncbi:MAG: LCP family protein [Lachnospiraceae bacterium]|nr:LCP family protein [Lachnospiraceae bacterium]